jgi:hypothetical protein
VIDGTFKKHLKEAFNATEDWDDIYDNDYVVQPSFVRAISDFYEKKV